MTKSKIQKFELFFRDPINIKKIAKVILFLNTWKNCKIIKIGEKNLRIKQTKSTILPQHKKYFACKENHFFNFTS